jgi:hypothetical protein
MRRLLGIAVTGLMACGGNGGFSEHGPGPSTQNPGGTIPVSPEGEVIVEDAKAILEVVPLDIWSQPLPEEGTRLSITHAGQTASHPKTIRYGIRSEGVYRVSLSHPEHFDLELPVRFDGVRLEATRPDFGSEPHGLSMTRGEREVIRRLEGGGHGSRPRRSAAAGALHPERVRVHARLPRRVRVPDRVGGT